MNKIKLYYNYYIKQKNYSKILPAIINKVYQKKLQIKYLKKFDSKKEHLITIYNGQKMFVSSKDRGISFDLFANKIREVKATKEFIKILNKKDIVLDLGANIGYCHTRSKKS